MSTTFKVSDGDLFINVDTGRLEQITDEVKLSQDLAASLMLDLDIDRDYGGELNELASNNTLGSTANKALVSQVIAEAVSRLQASQQADVNATQAETITGIKTLNVVQDSDAKSTIYFFLEVRNELGEDVGVVQKVTKPTSLDHQVSKSAAVEV